MAVKFQLRRDTAANWVANNPILSEGEPGIETNTFKIKIGDGTTPWNLLDYAAGETAFSDLLGKPTTLAGYGITDAATSAQGALANTALQPNDNISELTNNTGYITSTVSSVLNITNNTASTSTTTGALTVTGGVGVGGTVTATSFSGNLTGQVSDISNHDTDDLAQGTTNRYYSDSLARAAVSVTDTGGDGSLSYNSTTGVLTYTGPSATEVRAHFSGGTGVTITNGSISIGQAVGTTSNVTFNSITGNVFTSLIDSSDSSAITITPDVILSAGLTVGNHIVPSSDVNIDLGTPERRFKSLYLSGNTIFLGDAVISTEGSAVNLPSGSSIGGTEITAYVDNAIAGLVNAAPATLDTLNELAAALGNDNNFSTTITTALSEKAPLNSPTFTGTVSGITAAMVGLGNVTNESKATMFTNPTFTGTVSGVTATHVGLGNVTNESKATMFTNPTFTGSTNIGVTTITGNATSGEGVLTVKNGLTGYELVFSVVDSWGIESKDILGKGWPVDFTASSFSFSTTDATTASTLISGDAVVINNDGSVNVAGKLTASSTTEATSTSAGALVVSGGIAVAKRIYMGNAIYMNGAAASNGLYHTTTEMGFDSFQNGAYRIVNGKGSVANLFFYDGYGETDYGLVTGGNSEIRLGTNRGNAFVSTSLNTTVCDQAGSNKIVVTTANDVQIYNNLSLMNSGSLTAGSGTFSGNVQTSRLESSSANNLVLSVNGRTTTSYIQVGQGTSSSGDIKIVPYHVDGSGVNTGAVEIFTGTSAPNVSELRVYAATEPSLYLNTKDLNYQTSFYNSYGTVGVTLFQTDPNLANKAANTSPWVYESGTTDANNARTIFEVNNSNKLILNRNAIEFLTASSEAIGAISGASGVITHNLISGSIWIHTGIAANFTANFTNVPTTTNRAINTVLILSQGATGFIPNAVRIDGVDQTIRWQGGSAPTGNAGKTDIVSFTLIRVGLDWTVLGSLTTYG